MPKSNNKLIDWVFFLLIALNLISFSNIQLYTAYNRYSSVGNFIVLFFLFIFKSRVSKKELQILLFLLLFSIYCLFTIYFTGGGIGSAITPLIGILIIFNAKRLNTTPFFIKLLFLLLLVLNVHWIIRSPGYYTKFLFNQQFVINSNTVGIILTFCTMYLCIMSKYVFGKKYYLFNTVTIISNLWALTNVQSRNSLLGLVSFLILNYLIPKPFFKNKNNFMTVFMLIIILGLLLPYVFTNLYVNGVNVDLPFFNKSIYTGRELIWNNYFNLLKTNKLAVFWGLGSKIVLWAGDSLNAHNNYLALTINFGLIGFVLYFGFLFYYIYSIKFKELTNTHLSLLIGFLAVLVLGYFEVNILWVNLAYLNFLFLGINLPEEKIENLKLSRTIEDLPSVSSQKK